MFVCLVVFFYGFIRKGWKNAPAFGQRIPPSRNSNNNHNHNNNNNNNDNNSNNNNNSGPEQTGEDA